MTDGAKENAQTPQSEELWEEQADGLMAQQATTESGGGEGDITAREAFAPLALFLISAVSGALTAMVLVYGTIQPGITLNSVLMFPLVLLAMILAVPAWALVYLTILKGVEDVLRAVYGVVFGR